MIRTRPAILALALALTASAALAWPSVDNLAGALSGDPAARVEAVQLLPRYGAAAIAPVLPLLHHENPTVAKAAYHVLWAVANELRRPGRESEAAEASRLLQEALAAEAAEPQKDRLLRLLAMAVPEPPAGTADPAPGYRVDAIAALLGDERWREPARTTLERIGTGPARAALRGALRGADGPFAAALLSSLADLRDDAVLPAARELARGTDPAARAAAARCIAWRAEPTDADTVRSVVASADDASRTSAVDAYLCYAEALVARPDAAARALAATLYRELLKGATAPSAQDAALLGLARTGGAAVVGEVLAHVHEGDLRGPAAIVALGEVRGEGADEAVAAAWPGVPANVRAAFLRMMGRRGSDPCLAQLGAATKDADAAIRLVAIATLSESGLAGAVTSLAAVAAEGDPGERATAIAGLERLATGLRAAGASQAAGRAYAAILEHSRSLDHRRAALQGLASCPTPEAADLILGASDDPDLVGLVGPALVGAAVALSEAGQRDQASRALDALARIPLVGEPVSALLGAFGPRLGELDLPHKLGFVSDWWLVGPFPFGGPGTGLAANNVSEPKVDLASAYKAGDAELRWSRRTLPPGSWLIDLTPLYGMPPKMLCYGYTRVEAADDCDAVFRMGSDDGIRLWVNGDLVWDHDVDRPNKLDEDAAPAKLRRGTNELLVEVSQGAGGWNFCLRATTPDGRAIPLTVTNP